MKTLDEKIEEYILNHWSDSDCMNYYKEGIREGANFVKQEMQREIEDSRNYVSELERRNESLKFATKDFWKQHNQSSEKIVKLKKEIDQLKLELKNPYCPACSSCGDNLCCPAEMCLHPDIKSETVLEYKELLKSVASENSKLKALLDKAVGAFTKIESNDLNHDWASDIARETLSDIKKEMGEQNGL
jgi:hypothetical protein